jgi:tetratricopeptide (TPR) repeat protein
MWTAETGRNFRAALEIANRFREVAELQSDPNDRWIADGILALTQHYLGDQPRARDHIERMLENFSADRARSQYYYIRFQFDHRIVARLILARILSLQGFADQASRAVESALCDARDTGQPVAMCNVLAHAACPIALWSGDLEAAEKHTRSLQALARKYGLRLWCELGLMYEATIAMERGDVGGLRQVRNSYETLGEALPAFDRMKFRTVIADGLARSGHSAEGLTVVDQAIARSNRTGELWLYPELLRIKGALLTSADTQDASSAESVLREAIDWSRRQGAALWELRTAITLAEFLQRHEQHDDSLAMLEEVYARLSDRGETADLQRAKQLIDALR